MRVTHSWTDTTASIAVEGLKDSVRLLHVTDAHIALIDERDLSHLEACQERCRHWGQHRRDDAGQSIATSSTFDQIMTQAGELSLDLVALTGDILDFPAQASIESAAASVAKANAPFLYTSGNHDWHFPDLTGRDELREAWWPALAPLHGGHAACSRVEIGGIQFLAFDNSTYQISDAQLAFAVEHLARPMPTVALLHVPLSLPTLRAPTIARWQAPILMGDPHWDDASRENWEAGVATPATLEFIRRLSGADNFVAVLCGHIHFAHVDNLSPQAAQYAGAPAFDGAARLFEFHPLSL